MQIPHRDFAHLIDPTKPICTLLGSHWVALKQVMATIVEKQYDLSSKGLTGDEKSMNTGAVRWLKYLNRQIPPEQQQYNQWPVWVEGQLDQDMSFFGRKKH
jgi:hypothetical protein